MDLLCMCVCPRAIPQDDNVVEMNEVQVATGAVRSLLAGYASAFWLIGCTCVHDMPPCGSTPENSSAGVPPSDSTCGLSRRATRVLVPSSYRSIKSYACPANVQCSPSSEKAWPPGPSRPK